MLQVTERTPSARRNRRPRTRAKRILAAAGGFAIVLGLLGTLAVYTGTPLGDWLARRSAVEYADQTYPGYGFEVEWISNRHWLCYEVGPARPEQRGYPVCSGAGPGTRGQRQF